MRRNQSRTARLVRASNLIASHRIASHRVSRNQSRLPTDRNTPAPLHAKTAQTHTQRAGRRFWFPPNAPLRTTRKVPPSSVEIMDPSGRSLEDIYGPLNEGAELTLLCLAKGGELKLCRATRALNRFAGARAASQSGRPVARAAPAAA